MTRMQPPAIGSGRGGAGGGPPAVGRPSVPPRPATAVPTLAAQPAEDFKARLRRWVLRASVLGIGASLLIHLMVLVFAALIYFQTAQAGGAGTREPGEIEMAIITEAELQQLEAAAMEVETPSVADLLGDAPEGPPMDTPAGEDLPGAAEDIGGIAQALRGTGDGLDDGSGLGAGGTGGGAASFFGVEAKGSRFAYLVDISGSMRGPPLATLKIELNESIKSLLEHMTFTVFLFNHEAFALGGRSKWTEATESGKMWALERIKELEANGGTNPVPGFQMIFRMTPRPEAIYFMTDGIFDASAIDEIARLNRAGRRVPIHCITFGDRTAEFIMREIAKQSGGTYHHVEGPP